ncbi:hypothetical protein S83_039879 [Arachis hypogaea]
MCVILLMAFIIFQGLFYLHMLRFVPTLSQFYNSRHGQKISSGVYSDIVLLWKSNPKVQGSLFGGFNVNYPVVGWCVCFMIISIDHLSTKKMTMPLMKRYVCCIGLDWISVRSTIDGRPKMVFTLKLF